MLDTWFSSALWPFATLGWPQRTAELDRFYPTQVLSTARDIIFLWVARMVMMGCEFMGEEPFADVTIHSVVQAPDGRRMSKSLGTGIDPLEEIDRHGADAVRFGLLMMSSDQDVQASARSGSPRAASSSRSCGTPRAWSPTAAGGPARARRSPPRSPTGGSPRASRPASSRRRSHLERFELSKLADLVYHLVFDDFCDWYLELLKAGEAAPEMAGAGRWSSSSPSPTR